MKSSPIAKTKVGPYTVSTIRLSFTDGDYTAYETMVFKKVGRFKGGLGTEMWSTRWSSEEKAREGHLDTVKKIEGGWKP